MRVKLVKTFMGYLYLECDVETALKVLEYAKEKLGRDTEDVNDSIRIVKNFDVFYEMARKKFKDYIAPKKSESDLIRGLVFIDKIKLSKSDGDKLVVLIFDKRISEELIKNILNSLNIKYEFSK